MTVSPNPILSLELHADQDVVVCDFTDFRGVRLRGRERHALHSALDDAIASLNLRLARSTNQADALG